MRKVIVARLAIETMTTDQLTLEQKAVSSLVRSFFDSHGWGFGVSMVTRRDDITAVPGRYGWDGGLGTSWYSDPMGSKYFSRDPGEILPQST